MSTFFLSHEDAALRNRNNILHFVKKNSPVSRTDIWEQMDISRASVTQVIRQLQEANLILEEGEGESTGGRKPRFLKFNGAAKKIFAYDWLSRTLALLDLGGKILYEKSVLAQERPDPEKFISSLKEHCDQILSLHLCPKEEILGLSISLPGLIDHKNHTVLYSVELNWKNVCLGTSLSDRFGENIFIERAANILSIGANQEFFRSAIDHFQLFVLGFDGVGVASVVRGRSHHGANHLYGELGHVKILSDVLCSCGQRGCLEAVIQKEVLENGNSLSEKAMDLLALAVSTSVNLGDPSAVVLTGSYVDLMSPDQRNGLVSLIRKKLTGMEIRNLEIRFATDIKHLALSGLASYAFDQLFPVD